MTEHYKYDLKEDFLPRRVSPPKFPAAIALDLIPKQEDTIPLGHKKAAPSSVPAQDFLQEALTAMQARAALRDTPNGERTAKKIAEVFNAFTGHKLTEVDAWAFLLIMKMVRSRSGNFHKDDGVDGCAYFALMSEADSQNPNRES